MKLSIYIHFPFCVKRCDYCDFNTYAGKDNLIPDYIRAIVKEIQIIAGRLDNQYQVHTLYFGGGTPSLMKRSEIRDIIGEVKNSFEVVPDPEITLEANPGTLDQSKIKEFRENCINRISIGVQSFQAEELKILGRIHSPKEAVEVFKKARLSGFENINLDLIYGLPAQTLDSWKDTLHKAVALEPAHLSLYSLQVEPGTLLETQIRCGKLPAPDEDLSADMYEWAMDQLQREGFQQYEISNWCRVDKSGKQWISLHNLQYWKNLPYVGIGAGAHGSIRGVRTENVKEIEKYIDKFNVNDAHPELLSPANEKATEISKWEEIQETMMLGLRLTQQGIMEDEFVCRFGKTMGTFFPKQIKTLQNQKLLEWDSLDGKRILRLTRKGRLLGNRVFSEFVGNPAPKRLD